MLESALGSYDNFMRDRGFVGVDASLIREWWNNLKDKDSCLILEALMNGEVVGGILVAHHGRAATYLIGWSNQIGRKLSANNLLLWSAIKVLKERDCSSFELGGLDYESTPEIAYFKSGLGSEEFELVGEFVKCL